MADVIITVSDSDTGVCTVFETLQLDCEEQPKKIRSRPQHRDRSNHSNSPPVVSTSRTGFPFEDVNDLKPCSYYRAKYCCTGHHELPQDLNSWINYMTLKKSAAEKVVKKMASQQQQLAADASDQKRNHVLLQAQESEDRTKKSLVPPKRKTLKLQPLQVKPLTPVK